VQAQGTSFLRSLGIQGRVIYAMFMRETLTRYGRHNIGFLWLFVEPMAFTLGVSALWSAFQAVHGSHIPIIAFGVTGYSAVLLWRNMPSRLTKAIEPNAALLYHRNVRIFDIYAARVMLEAVGATMSFALLTVIFWAIGSMPAPENILKITAAWLLLAWFGAALALFVGALSETYEMVEKLWHPIGYLAFGLSGAAFIVDAFPPEFREILLYVPMLHGSEMLRDGYFGSMFRAHYDVLYLVNWSMALTLLGLIESRKLARRISPQ
jgi:ABC-type polysaccharide/polyol phosphate export permease